MIPVLPPNEENLRLAAQELSAGQLVAFPTETVYGLGANALDPLALARIFETKRRPFFDPLIIHIADRNSLTSLTSPSSITNSTSLNSDRDPRAEKLMDKFWPGPLTLVFPKSNIVPDLATSGLSSVAIRMPSHPVALQLIRLAGFPLAAPSANPFGRLSPTKASHVQDQFTEGISLILDGGPCEVGVESSIVSFMGETPVLLRAGGVSREEIETVIGPIEVATMSSVSRNEGQMEKPLAPGQLPGHYAPRTRLRLLETPVVRDPAGNITSGSGMIFAATMQKAGMKLGWLGFRTGFEENSGPFQAKEVLSRDGNLREAATNLFACLHRLDHQGLDMILAEPVPEEGLGLAIMDRLRKAAAGSAQNL